MKKIVFYFILIVPMMLFSEFTTLNEDWLSMDKSNILTFMNAVHSKEQSMDSFKQKMKGLTIKESENLGFGLHRLYGVEQGGYTTLWMTFYLFEDKLLYYKAVINGKNDVSTIRLLMQGDLKFFQLIERQWKTVIVEGTGDASLYFDSLNTHLYQEFQEKVERNLGEMLPLSVHEDLQKEYNLLISPFEFYDFGKFCNHSLFHAKAKSAIAKIKKEKPEFLKNILRAYSAEGRTYAIEALFSLVDNGQIKLTKADIEVIKKVLNLDVSLSKCDNVINR
jgi:hypothetical protein